MSFFELLLIAFGLSADAFAVSLCKGLCMHKINIKMTMLISFSFAIFQAAMPLLGYFLASRFRGYVESFDHWIAFALLAFLGIKMLADALKKNEGINKEDCPAGIRISELFVLSVATSIDALAVGITFAILSVNLFHASLIIGLTTFTLSFIGVIIGNRFGIRFKKPAEIVGGLILVLIGFKILADHMLFI